MRISENTENMRECFHQNNSVDRDKVIKKDIISESMINTK